MSKIGKKLINIPKGVDVKFENGLILVKGPMGELKKSISSSIEFKVEDSNLKIWQKNDSDSALWGLTSALVRNMIKGVIEGFEKVLEFQGIGYKAIAKGNDMELSLGFSHPVSVKAPEGISFKIEKNTIRILGIDKELVGQVTARIRSYREPEPYKGSGIRYQGEIIKRKAGKKAVSTS